jgi:hypothetical protein
VQVGFLASAMGPRVAASCASAALSVLTVDDDSRLAIFPEMFYFSSMIKSFNTSVRILEKGYIN